MLRFLRILILFLLPVLVGACAQAKWAPDIRQESDLAWPPPPQEAKITYQGELGSFDQTSGNLVTFLTGKSSSGRILKPVALAVSPQGMIAIADQDRKGIHLYSPADNKYTFLFRADKKRLASPVGVAFGKDERLYVTDSLLGRVLIFSRQGEYLDAIDQARGRPLNRPTGITYHSGEDKIYLSDTARHRILTFDSDNLPAGSFGERGKDIGRLNFPTHLATGPEGRIYITDSLNFRAQILSPEKNKWRAFGEHGNGSGNFASPKGIAVDSSGYIYIAETLFDTVQIFNDKGRYLLGLGSRGTGPAQFWMPSGIAIDHRDRLYVCDTYNKRIQIFQLHTDTE